MSILRVYVYIPTTMILLIALQAFARGHALSQGEQGIFIFPVQLEQETTTTRVYSIINELSRG